MSKNSLLEAENQWEQQLRSRLEENSCSMKNSGLFIRALLIWGQVKYFQLTNISESGNAITESCYLMIEKPEKF